MSKPIEFTILLAIVKVPDDDRCDLSLPKLGAQLATSDEFTVQRYIDGRHLTIMTPEELLLVRIIDVLDDDGSSCCIDEDVSLDGMVVDRV